MIYAIVWWIMVVLYVLQEQLLIVTDAVLKMFVKNESSLLIFHSLKMEADIHGKSYQV